MTIPSPPGPPAPPRIDPVIRIWSGLVGAVLLVWWLAFVTFSLFHFLVAWGRPSNIFFMVLEFVTPWLLPEMRQPRSSPRDLM